MELAWDQMKRAKSATMFAAVSFCPIQLWSWTFCIIAFFFNLAVDCTWNQWSEWTKCEEKCPVSEEDGKVHRYRSKNEHQCGGAPCQGDSKETKTCHIIAIMKDENEGQQDEIDQLKTEKDDCQSKIEQLGKSQY